MVTESFIEPYPAQEWRQSYTEKRHNPMGVYSEKPHDYLQLMKRLRDKIDSTRDQLPAPILREESECEIGIIYLGSMENTIQEIDDILESTGLKVSQCRLRALPAHSEIEKFIERHQTTIVLEINRDGHYMAYCARKYQLIWCQNYVVLHTQMECHHVLKYTRYDTRMSRGGNQ